MCAFRKHKYLIEFFPQDGKEIAPEMVKARSMEEAAALVKAANPEANVKICTIKMVR